MSFFKLKIQSLHPNINDNVFHSTHVIGNSELSLVLVHEATDVGV